MNNKQTSSTEDHVFYGKNTKIEERICSAEEILKQGVYRLRFTIQVPPLARTVKEPTPAFYVGIVEDGWEDKKQYGEKWCFKRIFGANSKLPDNKGMMSKIDGDFEYQYDLEKDLINDQDNQLELLVDFDKNIFRILGPKKKNIFKTMPNYINLQSCNWRIYFGWVGSTAKLTIGDFTRSETKIKPRDKYGRTVDINTL